ncbi:hypothetical protein C3747_54g175 [Trypanosoma cruzi]|uniref:C2 domain-containing protein n=2 Tax=Trypanosoma cruzi TaxID=5693 RepID=A0A2V2WTX9_TRYCR|nr:hypothetical protein C3747_54g175 [Trypanosoma cruzi]
MSLENGIQQGRITVKVHRADSLVALNPDGSSNPCVTATIGQQSQTTAVVRGTTNPSFDATLTFIACPLPTILTLRVYNKATYTEAEELLGSATLTLFSASPMTRRTLQLGHGGNVSLSQKARDGCGSLDVSYEVVIMTPSEVAAQTKKSVANDDLPEFLRDDSGIMKFTSAYAAVEQPPPAPPPPPQVTALPAPSEPLGAPQLSQPPQPMQPASTQMPQLPSMLSPPQPTSVQQPHFFSSTSGLLGAVAVPPPTPQNASEPVTRQNPFVMASSSTPPVVPPKNLPTNPSFTVAQGVESPAAPIFSGSTYPTASSDPAAPTGQSLHAMQPSMHGISTLGDAFDVQQVANTGGVMAGEFASRPMPLPSSQSNIRPNPAAISSSVNSSTTPDTTFASSSSATSSRQRPQQQDSGQNQQQQFVTPLPPPPAPGKQPLSSPQPSTSVTGAGIAPTAATHTTATTTSPGRDNEKPLKKVTIMASAKDQTGGAATATTKKSTNAVTKRALVKALPLADRGSRLTAVSPMRENRRSSSANGARSSSRGRASALSATLSTAHHSPALYQWPDDLLAAAAEGNTAVFQKLREDDPLLSRGFDNVRDYSGRTILHIAAWHGHTNVLRTLLQASPSVPIIELRALRSNNGNTVLHSAAQGGRADVVQWLRFGHPATGTLVGLRNLRGLTATDCAREAGFMDIATMLDES